MKIIIQGVANEGKSTVALMLERFLRDQGFTVTNSDEDRYDGSTGPNHEKHLLALRTKNLQIELCTQNVRE